MNEQHPGRAADRAGAMAAAADVVARNTRRCYTGASSRRWFRLRVCRKARREAGAGRPGANPGRGPRASPSPSCSAPAVSRSGGRYCRKRQLTHYRSGYRPRQIATMPGVDPIAVLFVHRTRRVKRLRRPAHRAIRARSRPRRRHIERGLRPLSDRRRVSRVAEEPSRARNHQVRHRDAAKRDGWRVGSQGNPLQNAREITRGERPCRSRDQQVRSNPDTLVTPTCTVPALPVSR